MGAARFRKQSASLKPPMLAWFAVESSRKAKGTTAHDQTQPDLDERVDVRLKLSCCHRHRQGSSLHQCPGPFLAIAEFRCSDTETALRFSGNFFPKQQHCWCCECHPSTNSTWKHRS